MQSIKSTQKIMNHDALAPPGTNGDVGGGDGRPSGITYAGQSSLPRLPIPPLEDTLERFSSAVRALLDVDCDNDEDGDDGDDVNNGGGGGGGGGKEWEECQESVRKFLATDGPKLQSLLVEYDERGRAAIETGGGAGDNNSAQHQRAVGSFVEEFWTDAYLAPDGSVVMNLNPFFVLEVSWRDCGFARAPCTL